MTAVGQTHPSFYVLDGVRLGVEPPPALASHLAACAACAGFVRGAGPATGVPDWFTEQVWEKRPRHPEAARPGQGWRWLGWLGGPAFAVAALLLFVRPGGDPDRHDRAPAAAPGVREKGAAQPTIRVFVRRQDQVFLWDGEAAIRPADRLQLEIRSGGHRYVSVAVHGPEPQHPAVIYAGRLRTRAGLLPRSFRVDDHGHQEILSVILARSPIADETHRRGDERGDAGGLWRQILILEKDVPDDGAPAPGKNLVPPPPPQRSNR